MGYIKTGQSLDAQERYDAHILRNLHEAILVLDKHFVITYWNNRAEEILGWSDGEALGRKAKELLKPAFPDSSWDTEIKKMLEQNRYEGFMGCRQKNGGKIYGVLHANVLRDEAGGVTEIIASIWDSTKRKQDHFALKGSLRAMKRKNDEFQALIDSMFEELFILDKLGAIHMMNKSTDAKCRSKVQETIKNFESANIRDLTGAAIPAADLPHLRLLRGERVVNCVLRTDASGQDRIYVINGQPVFDESGGFEKAILLSHDITQIMQCSEKIAFQANLLSVVNEAIVAIDQKRVITYWNDAAHKLYGWSEQEVLGHKLKEFHQSAGPNALCYDAVRKMLTEDCWRGETTHYHKDGRPILVEAYTRVLRDQRGSFQGVITAVRDVTQRRVGIETIRRNEETKEFLLKLSDSLKQLDNPADIQNTAARVLGEHLQADRAIYCDVVTIEDTEYYNIQHMYHVPEAPLPTGLQQICNYGRKANAENVEMTRVVCDVHAEPLIEEADYPLYQSLKLSAWIRVPLVKKGRYVACLVVQQSSPRDWTPQEISLVEETAERTWAALERSRAQRALCYSRRKLKAINEVYEKYVQCETLTQLGAACLELMESITDSRLSFAGELGSDGLFHDIAVSKNGFDACRMRVKTGHGLEFAKFSLKGLYGSVVRSGKTLMTDAPGCHPDSIGIPEGHVPIKAFLGVPYIREGKVLGIIAVANREGGYTADQQEILEALTPTVFEVLLRKRAEEELEKSRRHALSLVDELEKADSNKNEFLSTLSHELRNPLAVVSAGLQLLDMTDEPDRTRKFKDIMRHQILQLCSLVDDLLDLTRIAHNKVALNVEPVELYSLSRLAAEDIMPLFDDKGVRLETRIARGTLNLEADPVRLKQIIGNLLQNALKFTDADGEVVLSVYRQEGDAVICVKDTGIGIKQELLESLFIPFMQADSSLARPRGGLGLGLAIVKGIAELHGGNAYAQSEGAGKGSSFYIKLPASSTGSKDSAGKMEAAESEPCLHILVIDDNREFADVLCSMLELFGHRTESAFDGEEGFRRAIRMRPDVVFCDIGLPEMNGYEVARAIRGEEGIAGTCLVAVSGYAAKKDQECALQAGFDRHMAKPIDKAELQAVLEDVGKKAREGLDSPLSCKCEFHIE